MSTAPEITPVNPVFTPEKKEHRRIIICCDGTWNDRETRDPFTNVSKIINCIATMGQEDGKVYHQIPIYLDGIGTGTTWFGKRLDGATGASMDSSLFCSLSEMITSY